MTLISKRTVSEISYWVRGSGPALILINGLARSASHWFEFEKILADRFTVITFDPRGIGKSNTKLNWNLTVEHLAQDVRDIVQAEKLKSAFVYGFSLGGMVALSLSLAEPDVFTKVVCVNSSVGGWPRMRINPKALLTMIKGGIFRSNLHLDLSYFLLSRELGHNVRISAVDSWHSIERQQGRPVFQTMKQLGAAIRFSRPRALAKIGVPVLIVCGSNDVFVPIVNSKILAKLIPNSKYCCIPEGGHEIHVEQPLLLKTILSDYLL
jgi:pimeloyl-ACP methyl ester carboxylesterase